jgi:hypothetical protein
LDRGTRRRCWCGSPANSRTRIRVIRFCQVQHAGPFQRLQRHRHRRCARRHRDGRSIAVVREWPDPRREPTTERSRRQRAL